MTQATRQRRAVIAVTGSAGKTTTKEMIAAVLKRRWKIFKSPNNLNAPRSTKRHAGQLRTSHLAAVLEYGMQFHGNIKKHCLYLQPSIGVITNVGRAHVGNFGGSIKGVAKAKSELIRYMKPTGMIVLNADDIHSELLQTKGFKGKIIKIGIRKEADYRASDIRFVNNGMRFRARFGGTMHSFYIPSFGEHNIYNALFAIAVSHRLGFSPQEMQQGLKSYVRSKGRLHVHHLGSSIKVIDDSFNANPDAAKAALDVLSVIGKQTNIAVLGSMFELGQYAAKGHQEVGRYAAVKKISRIYTLGGLARQIAIGARKGGFPAAKLKSFAGKHQLQRELAKEMKPGTTVLLKGGNSLRMSTMVAYLKRNARMSRKR